MPIIPILVGATASGKTSLILRLARRLPHIEVISADSRQVYRTLSIGTAKPTPSQRAAVPHHLVDMLDPSEAYSAGRFRADAEAAIANCLERGALPVVVGGTGLYLRALTEGLSPLPRVPDQVKRQLRRELDALGLSALYRRLHEVDPAAARKIEPNDVQRILRALSVHAATGRPLSAWWDTPPNPPLYDARWLGIRWPRERLRERIRRRTEEMLSAGLEGEVRSLLESGYTWETNALRTVGYREWRPYFAGEATLDEVAAHITTHTQQYAKRQMTWFRANERIYWLDGGSGGTYARALEWLKDAAMP